ncbi:Alpha-2-macroglobulin receptor-associated protein [Dirofilaria immitis]|nr:Alpha-2-macroglobulin receptor-associated protein [Dirofilaria immitis]
MASIKIALLLMILIRVQLFLGGNLRTWMDASFRTNKLNFVWSKAVHHLSDKALIKRLKDELDKFDLLYLSVKPANIKTRSWCWKRWTISLYNSSRSMKYKWRNEEEVKEENSVLSLKNFNDPKLQKLWHVARNSRFSKAALEVLHKELKDHEQKLKQYEQKVQLFSEFNGNTLTENSFEMNDRLNRELKVNNNDILDSYDKLHQKALQNSNLTASEMESIRIELNHFDKSLEKVKYHDEELKRAKKEQGKLGKSNIFDEDVSSFEEENKRLILSEASFKSKKLVQNEKALSIVERLCITECLDKAVCKSYANLPECNR